MDLVYYGKIKSYVANLLSFLFNVRRSDIEPCEDGLETI